jgi:hypothetical protein
VVLSGLMNFKIFGALFLSPLRVLAASVAWYEPALGSSTSHQGARGPSPSTNAPPGGSQPKRRSILGARSRYLPPFLDDCAHSGFGMPSRMRN